MARLLFVCSALFIICQNDCLADCSGDENAREDDSADVPKNQAVIELDMETWKVSSLTD